MPDSPLTRPPPPSSFRTGRLILGRYRLERPIANGGMAEVWQATDQVLDRQVAVKILHPHLATDDSFVTRFRSEAVAAARLHHPGIVSVYDTGHEGGAEAIVMELVEGRNLRDELDEHGFLAASRVSSVGAQVADALSAAHRAGIVHRDIKPANILVCTDDRVMVTDFGIAKFRDQPDLTQDSSMLGTVKYLAPEQVRGEPVDGRSDIYALGVVLYEALCSRPPFEGDSPSATALARLHHLPPHPRQLRATIPQGLDAVVMRCLQIDPADRYAAAHELRSALLEPRTGPDDADLTVSLHGDATTSTARGPFAARAPLPQPPKVLVPRRSSHAVWIRPLVITSCIIGAVGLALVLFSRTDFGRAAVDWGTRATRTTTPGSGAAGRVGITPTRVAVTAISSFDPEGSGPPGENDALLPLAIDGNPTTGWSTEGYDQRSFGIKSGVGVILSIAEPTALRDLAVQSPSQGWAASVYLTDQPGTTLKDWGAPVDRRSEIRGDVKFDLHGRKARHVLVWITDLGSGPPRVHVELDELVLHG